MSKKLTAFILAKIPNLIAKLIRKQNATERKIEISTTISMLWTLKRQPIKWAIENYL